MRLPRKFSGLLAAAMMAAGLTAAATPAHAGTPAPYWEIITATNGLNSPLECLQGDLGGPLGSSVTQHFCDPTGASADQLWLPISTGGNGFKFQNAASGRCLEARNGAVNGGAVALWDCSSTESNTRWAWGPSNPGQFPFPDIQAIQSRVSGTTGYCLDVPGNSTAIGLALQTYRCNNTNAQLYWITTFQ